MLVLLSILAGLRLLMYVGSSDNSNRPALTNLCWSAVISNLPAFIFLSSRRSFQFYLPILISRFVCRVKRTSSFWRLLLLRLFLYAKVLLIVCLHHRHICSNAQSHYFAWSYHRYTFTGLPVLATSVWYSASCLFAYIRPSAPVNTELPVLMLASQWRCNIVSGVYRSVCLFVTVCIDLSKSVC